MTEMCSYRNNVKGGLIFGILLRQKVFTKIAKKLKSSLIKVSIRVFPESGLRGCLSYFLQTEVPLRTEILVAAELDSRLTD